MNSAPLEFIFKNSFGFDTLTENGCFEEGRPNGFVTAAKTLAIENLNNIGINIGFNSLLKLSIFKIFIIKIIKIKKRL